jgi:hypothetical protein
MLDVRRIRRINHDPVESDEDRAPESIWNTEKWLNRNGNLDNPPDSEDDCVADDKCHIEQNTTSRIQNAQSCEM